jgi:putative sigma-54 modulation protein
VARQISPLAELTIELKEERNEQVVEGALRLKGVTLRARESANDMGHALNLLADDLTRQVKKHRDKRRNRRETQRAAAQEHAA